jgi:hypothetical protein
MTAAGFDDKPHARARSRLARPTDCAFHGNFLCKNVSKCCKLAI